MEKVLRFLGSKWFTLVLMVAMALFIPTTWHNLSVVIEAGELTKYWWIIAVFLCNVAATLMAFWKFMGAITKKKEQTTTGEW